MAEAAARQAKVKLISKIVKKNLVENIVPIIVNLKGRLAELKSPLLKNLMAYLCQVGPLPRAVGRPAAHSGRALEGD